VTTSTSISEGSTNSEKLSTGRSQRDDPQIKFLGVAIFDSSGVFFASGEAAGFSLYSVSSSFVGQAVLWPGSPEAEGAT
jgi:hypothetical protein